MEKDTAKQWGKFDSSEELLKAYNNLQSAFTRKCQQLNELKRTFDSKILPESEPVLSEKENNVLPPDILDNADILPDKAVADNDTALITAEEDNSKITEKDNGTELLAADNDKIILPVQTDNSENIYGSKENGSEDIIGDKQEKTSDNLDGNITKFFDSYPEAKKFALQIGQTLNTVNPDFTDLLAAYNTVLTAQQKDYSEIARDQNFLNEYIYSDERIRQYFIKDYLLKIRGGSVPQTIKGGISVISVMPPIRAKSLKDAANLAREILNNKGVN